MIKHVPKAVDLLLTQDEKNNQNLSHCDFHSLRKELTCNRRNYFTFNGRIESLDGLMFTSQK